MSEILKQIVDVAEAARMTGLTIPGFMYHVRHRRIKPEGLIGGALIFKRETIERFIAEREASEIAASKEAGRL